MHLPASTYIYFLQLLVLSSLPTARSRGDLIHTSAIEAFDCKHVKAGKDFVFDLSKLPGPVTITDTESTPPSETTTSITIRLCESLDREPVAEPDQCPPGTRFCLKISNKKNGDDRLIQVIGAGGTEKDLVWSAELGKQLEGSERALELEMHGSLYAQQTQKTEIKFLCDTKAATDSKPTMKSYDKKDGELKLEWITPHACATSFGGGSGSGNKDDAKKGDSASQSSGGWGFFSWFFFLVFVGGIAYFALGYWRNYNEYGVIELPNKDFWREAPYIAKDMGKHIYSTVSGQGSSRGSYEPV